MTIERYRLMLPVLSQYKRRFSVVDIGAGIYLTTSPFIAQNFDCVVTAIEQDPIRSEALGALPRYMVLRRHLDSAAAHLLASCEHFDVVLALNLLHHMGDEWKEMLRAVLLMGTHIYVQVPRTDEAAPGSEFVPELTDKLRTYGMVPIGETSQFPRHPPRTLWYKQNGDRVLTRTHMDAHIGSADTLIHATPTKVTANMRRLNKGRKEWIAGINLRNFCRLGGVHPSKAKVLRMLHDFPLPSEVHGDVAPHNFLIDGERLHLVDGFEGHYGDDAGELRRTEKEVEEMLCSA